MRALLLAILLVPAGTLADEAKLRTHVSVEGESEVVRTSFGEAVRAKLDACWKKPTRTKAKITFDAGKVSAVELSVKLDPATLACVTAALETATLAGIAGRVTAVIALEARTGRLVLLLKKDNRKVLDTIFTNKLDMSKLTAPEKDRGGGSGMRGTGAGRIHDGRKDGVDSTGPGDAPPPVKAVVGPVASHQGSLSREHVDRVVRARTAIFRRCYQKELSKNAALAGEVLVRFEVVENGAVKLAEVASSTLASTPTEGCIVHTIKRLRFPGIGATANVTYPFIFAPR